MKRNILSVLVVTMSLTAACGNEQQETRSSADTDTNAVEGTSVESPTSATSSAGSSGMGGATSTHALASDSIKDDSIPQE